MSKIAIAVHGGAGTIKKELMTAEKEFEYKRGLEDAIEAGYALLEKGESALDAVEASVIELENNPLFNAGKGSVFSHEGKNEMDASIMDGSNLKAGAVAGIHHVKNPISVAKAVMDNSLHIMLSGEGAENFAKERQFDFEDDKYFFSQQRYDQWQKAREKDIVALDHLDENKFGTVGSVAIDRKGNLASATSTGGTTNKKFGRIGDSPIIGAGTYANNKTCAVSCTGDGESFITKIAAYDVSCLMEYKGLSLKEAVETVVNHKLKSIGGEGGMIAIDSQGNIEMLLNSMGMYRASKQEGNEIVVGIYK